MVKYDLKDFLDRLCVHVGDMHKPRHFLLAGAVIAFINCMVSMSITYFAFADMPAHILQRALWLSGLIPLMLVSIACIILMRVFYILHKSNRSLQEAVDLDTLTSIANRAAFYREGKAAFTKAQLNKQKLSIIMLDIDFFKAINDNLGHLAGDKALQHLAAIFSRASRDSDLPARWGGEEFAILLDGADLDTARKVAERLRKIVSEEPLIWNGEQVFITLSAGVAELNEDDLKLEDMILRADRALYHAKACGRNQVHAPSYSTAAEAVSPVRGPEIAALASQSIPTRL